MVKVKKSKNNKRGRGWKEEVFQKKAGEWQPLVQKSVIYLGIVKSL